MLNQTYLRFFKLKMRFLEFEFFLFFLNKSLTINCLYDIIYKLLNIAEKVCAILTEIRKPLQDSLKVYFQHDA